MISTSISPATFRRAEEMRAAGQSIPEVANALGIGRSTVRKIGRGQQRVPQEPIQCRTCRNKLTKLPCLMCRLKHRKQVAQFPAAEIPDGVSASERRKLELPLAGALPVRIANTLENVGIRTVCDVLHRTQRELLAVPGIGVENLRQILRALERLNFDTTKAWQALNRRIADVRKQA